MDAVSARLAGIPAGAARMAGAGGGPVGSNLTV